MDMRAILARIEQRQKALDLSTAAVGRLATGSTDTVRNWIRRTEKGQRPGATMDKIEAVARVLQVTPTWLLTGEGDATGSAAHAREDAAEWHPPPGTSGEAVTTMLRILAPDAARRTTLLLSHAAPAFGLLRGDVVIYDPSHSPEPGDLAVVTVSDGDFSDTYVMRFAPPWLCFGSTDAAAPIRADDASVAMRGPVLASFRDQAA